MAVTVLTLEEQVRGWLAEISRRSDPRQQIPAYAKLQRQVEVFALGGRYSRVVLELPPSARAHRLNGFENRLYRSGT